MRRSAAAATKESAAMAPSRALSDDICRASGSSSVDSRETTASRKTTAPTMTSKAANSRARAATYHGDVTSIAPELSVVAAVWPGAPVPVPLGASRFSPVVSFCAEGGVATMNVKLPREGWPSGPAVTHLTLYLPGRSVRVTLT